MSAGECVGPGSASGRRRGASMRPRHVCRGMGGRAQRLDPLPGRASMRPRHVCRGMARKRRSCRSGRIASMRPRHVCRGMKTSSRPDSIQYAGFNEAPACLPGNAPASSAPCQPSSMCFNEAPACLPGNGRSAPGWSGPRARFNEAPACLPGNAVERYNAKIGDVNASMRPRHVCRGMLRPVPPRLRDARPLQ